MALRSLVVRTSAVGLLAVGGLMVAEQYDLITSQGGAGSAATADAALEGGGMSFAPPDLATSSDVRLPEIAGPISPSASVRPARFDPDLPEVGAPVIDSEFSRFGLPCGLSVSATALPAAIVALDIMAPCQPETAVTITHAGLEIAARTDAMGLLTLDIPGFASPAVLAIRLTGMAEEVVTASLPDLKDFGRIGLFWSGEEELELHALEGGTVPGGPGHVWRDAPADDKVAVGGRGGFLSVIRTAGSALQIYTLPRTMLRDGSTLLAGSPVLLSVQVPVTPTNCARSVQAQTIRPEAFGTPRVADIAMTLPACDALGSVLVVRDPFSEITLASN